MLAMRALVTSTMADALAAEERAAAARDQAVAELDAARGNNPIRALQEAEELRTLVNVVIRAPVAGWPVWCR